MSIVGTRPPTLDEWNKYELHHRARLAIKPGMQNIMRTFESTYYDMNSVIKVNQAFHM